MKDENDERIHFIYLIKNVVNGKVYIGQTINPKKRWTDHISDSQNHTKARSYYFQRSIAKHGVENFTHEIIDQCNSQKEADDKEIYWIAFYDSTDREKGMNLTKGGGGTVGKIVSNETREKLSKYHTGKKLSEETRKKLGERRKGKKSNAGCGESNSNAKLKEKDIIEIRTLHSNGLSLRKIAKIYNVHNETINKIVKYKKWKHVKMPSEG
jgi:group I intron endonuclease